MTEDITIEIRFKVPKAKKSKEKLFTKKGEDRQVIARRIDSQNRWRGRVGNRDKAGTVLTKPWEKGGRIVDIDPVPPPFLRSDTREARYGDGSNNRVGFTVPSAITRRVRNRRRNRMAKASRRANR